MIIKKHSNKLVLYFFIIFTIVSGQSSFGDTILCKITNGYKIANPVKYYAYNPLEINESIINTKYKLLCKPNKNNSISVKKIFPDGSSSSLPYKLVDSSYCPSSVSFFHGIKLQGNIDRIGI